MVTGFSVPSSTLNKKKNSVDYHWVGETVDVGVISLAHVTVKSKSDDLITNTLGTIRNYLLMNQLFV